MYSFVFVLIVIAHLDVFVGGLLLREQGRNSSSSVVSAPSGALPHRGTARSPLCGDAIVLYVVHCSSRTRTGAEKTQVLHTTSPFLDVQKCHGGEMAHTFDYHPWLAQPKLKPCYFLPGRKYLLWDTVHMSVVGYGAYHGPEMTHACMLFDWDLGLFVKVSDLSCVDLREEIEIYKSVDRCGSRCGKGVFGLLLRCCYGTFLLSSYMMSFG
ncbi:unnamed protein product [Ectocarpus sp. 6 AP-2014]